jgi:hypothetical protein
MDAGERVFKASPIPLLNSNVQRQRWAPVKFCRLIITMRLYVNHSG